MSNDLLYGDKNKIKAEIVRKIKSNQTLLKFLNCKSNNVDIPNQPDLTIDEVKKVVSECVYTVEKKPADLDKDIKCYICMTYGNKIYHENSNRFFNGSTFNFYVLCHKDFNTCLNGERVDAIEQCICDLFKDGKIGVTGDTFMISSEYISVNSTDYSGVQILVGFKDFNGDKNGR